MLNGPEFAAAQIAYGYYNSLGTYQQAQLMPVVPQPDFDAERRAMVQRIQELSNQPARTQPTMTGSKPIVVCNGQSVEAKDLAEAQATAEKLAHQHQADAYILKPVRKVAPKRDVVTTEIE